MSAVAFSKAARRSLVLTDMNLEGNSAWRGHVDAHGSLFARLFLIAAWVTSDDVVREGFATSPSEASLLLETLASIGLIESQGQRYCCSAKMLAQISALLPPGSDEERLQRRMRMVFQPATQETVVESTLIAFGCTAVSQPASVTRPPWYFDLNAIIHPALTVDRNLIITGCSDELCSFVASAFPDLRRRVNLRRLLLKDFLSGLHLYHFDYQTLQADNAHVLTRTDKFPAILQELAETGRVDKKPALIKLGSQQHYLELSFALQISFPGAQSIWHIVDSRVGQMKLIRAMRLTKWFITAHRLKQPTNLFNIARADLELLLEDRSQTLHKLPELRSDIAEVVASLSYGIEEFSRFVKEISGNEYSISTTALGDLDDVNVFDTLDDVISDISFVYALPQGVPITLDGCTHEQGHFVRVSPFLLREALFNLIHNAFKHGAKVSESPSIHIACILKPDRLIVKIEDSGPGMSSRALNEYTRTFNEMRTAVSPGEVGALSGLSLAMSVVKSCGGTIHFENMRPSGFRTTITLNGVTGDVAEVTPAERIEDAIT